MTRSSVGLAALLLALLLAGQGWGQSCDLAKQKALVESIYWKQQKAELEALQELGATPFEDGAFYLKGEIGRTKHLWDFFAPFYPCPVKERVGSMSTMGDTGKWVCGARTLLQHEDCHMYSFGLTGGLGAYEEEILGLAPQCELHVFDPTLQAATKARLEQNPRVFVHEYTLGPGDGPVELPQELGHSVSGPFPAKTLETIMDELGHAWIDVVKIDTETLEWRALEQVLFGGQKVMPFTQLLVEFHATTGINMLRVLAGLSQMGFRAFHQEPNIHGNNIGFQMVDYSYIQVDGQGDVVGSGASYELGLAGLQGCSESALPLPGPVARPAGQGAEDSQFRASLGDEPRESAAVRRRGRIL